MPGGGAGGSSTTGEESGLDALSRRKVKLDCGYGQDPETLGERRGTKEIGLAGGGLGYATRTS